MPRPCGRESHPSTDRWRQTSFSSTYSYHHGYFDGSEREFRGFGRVEQIDVETYGKFEKGNDASPYITKDKTQYLTVVMGPTWSKTPPPGQSKRQGTPRQTR
ncbi:MAG: toxin TcdB middle/N-terminal domain-containing protein [Gammaproteobacteria bacterium]